MMAKTNNWGEEIQYPKKGDTLIQGGGRRKEKTLFADWLAGDWGMYPDGYKMAADMVVDTMTGESWEDRLILPIISMYRHYVEVKLKHIIIEYDKLSGTRIDANKFGKHNLNSLWSYLLSRMGCVRSEPDKEIIDSITHLINELNNLDPDSMHFRYATDKERINAMPLPHSLSMIHFKEGMEILENGLSYVEAGIDVETEGRAIDAEMEAEMRSYMDF
jgi:hypothetical protein